MRLCFVTLSPSPSFPPNRIESVDFEGGHDEGIVRRWPLSSKPRFLPLFPSFSWHSGRKKSLGG